MLYYTPLSQEDIRWNFEKILFDRNGQPYKRYAPTTEPFELEEDIRFLIEKK
jgi:glutathione peroxidase